MVWIYTWSRPVELFVWAGMSEKRALEAGKGSGKLSPEEVSLGEPDSWHLVELL